MLGLSGILENMKEFREICGGVSSDRFPLCCVGLSAIHKAHMIEAVCEETGRAAMVITPDDASAVRLVEDINAFAGTERALYYPVRELVMRDVEGVSREYEFIRLNALRQFSSSGGVIVASAEGALQYTIPPGVLVERTHCINASFSGGPEGLIVILSAAGYQRRDQVDGVCQFAHRGGIVDFFSPGSADPCRIEFWGDEIDSISTFKLDTQRRDDTMKKVTVSPAREVLFSSPGEMLALLRTASTVKGKVAQLARSHIERDMERLTNGLEINNLDRYLPLIYSKPATLFDYLSAAPGGNGILFLSDPIAQRETLKNQEWQQQEDLKILFEEGLCFPGCDRYCEGFSRVLAATEKRGIILDTFARTFADISLREIYSVRALQMAPWGGELPPLLEDIQGYVNRGFSVMVLAGTDKGATALVDDLVQEGIDAHLFRGEGVYRGGQVLVSGGHLSSGFEYPEIKFALIAHLRTAGTKKKFKTKAAGDAIRSLSDLTPGDYVVHVTHGIGVFEGIIKREIQGVVKDYIRIRYAGTDTLFVPVTQLDLVSRYIGPREDSSVKLSKLGSAEWMKTRTRVKKAVADMAGELIKLYAARQQAMGFAFSADGDWQTGFEARFPYEETDDQLRCIAEIKADMESERPMDRVLCGDVGFGKTEVALRAAFKCVMDSKQCAVLVPTTILAWQHFQTFKNRLAGYPIHVELLSRFRTAKEQLEVIKEVKRGVVDIVIGTHRLIQKDVAFKDLGLCVIDEEQRFGVAHKERFKELRSEVDVLTLSATPIPRTLNMALSGIRDMSVIDEPPQDRHPVQTYVLEEDPGVLAEAMKREVRRGGQVFYLHNRIESIDGCAERIRKLLPDARVVCAHGQMSEEELSRIWRRLVEQDIDILVCTTIIETGVDVPTCNTLIVEDADRMGLSQLYQLRGRVGRSNRRAYAYFTFNRSKAISEIAQKRLSAIREFTSFGSGFRIAMRDMEIRGAGNILGAQQHGHMEAVGYEMYLRLLSEAVSEQQGKPVVRSAECTVDVQIGAHIPEEYIPNLSQRLDVYKKIAAIRTDEDSGDLIDELIDRFGDIPPAVAGLVDVALVRNTAAGLGIREISQRGDAFLLYPEHLDPGQAAILAGRLKGRVMVNAGLKPYYSVRTAKGQTPIAALREILTAMTPPPEAASGE